MHKRLLTCALLGGLLMVGMANAQTCTNTHMVESIPTSGFSFSSDGKIATHNATGLMWKRCLEGQTFSNNNTSDNYLDDKCTGSATAMNWQEALKQAQTANTANDSGYSDWRVPNLKELHSIVEHCRFDPATNTEVFPGKNYSLWSSTPEVNDPYYAPNACIVDFDNGIDSCGDRVNANKLRLVRFNPVQKVTSSFFTATRKEYSETSDLTAACQTEFGSAYKLADWTDLEVFYNAGGSISSLFEELDWEGYDSSLYVSKSGQRKYNTSRYYFATRHDGHLPTNYNYLSHTSIGYHIIDLGSWYNISMRALCYTGGE